MRRTTRSIYPWTGTCRRRRSSFSWSASRHTLQGHMLDPAIRSKSDTDTLLEAAAPTVSLAKGCDPHFSTTQACGYAIVSIRAVTSTPDGHRGWRRHKYSLFAFFNLQTYCYSSYDYSQQAMTLLRTPRCSWRGLGSFRPSSSFTRGLLTLSHDRGPSEVCRHATQCDNHSDGTVLTRTFTAAVTRADYTREFRRSSVEIWRSQCVRPNPSERACEDEREHM